MTSANSPERTSMGTDEARARAEKIFKQEELEREGRVAMSDYEARGRAIRENMARLRMLRLSKEAQAHRSASDKH
jgi:hypothetical protein